MQVDNDVLAVGSVNKEETEISAFSQRGAWVDIYTCGEDVEIKTLSGNTRTSDGTSYSAAKVTAYAAIILQEAEGTFTAAELREELENYTKTLPDGKNIYTEQMFLKCYAPYGTLTMRCIFYVNDSYSRYSFRGKS